MAYDPAPANAARLKMFHFIADKIERERAEYFRNFAPFAGVLTAAERRPPILECPFSH